MADRDRSWNVDAAEKRIRTWAGAEDEPNEKYYAKMDEEAPWQRD